MIKSMRVCPIEKFVSEKVHQTAIRDWYRLGKNDVLIPLVGSLERANFNEKEVLPPIETYLVCSSLGKYVDVVTHSPSDYNTFRSVLTGKAHVYYAYDQSPTVANLDVSLNKRIPAFAMYGEVAATGALPLYRLPQCLSRVGATDTCFSINPEDTFFVADTILTTHCAPSGSADDLRVMPQGDTYRKVTGMLLLREASLPHGSSSVDLRCTGEYEDNLLTVEVSSNIGCVPMQIEQKVHKWQVVTCADLLLEGILL